MERIPEPEIMSAEEEAKVYDLADFSEVNQEFAERVVEVTASSPGSLIDLGCGPGDILFRIFKLAPKFYLIGLDGGAAMTRLGEERAKREGLGGKINFVQGDAKKINFSPNTFDVVISNSLVHHLLDPAPFWREIGRVIKPGGMPFHGRDTEICRATSEASGNVLHQTL